jgi:hypothetical protein
VNDRPVVGTLDERFVTGERTVRRRQRFPTAGDLLLRAVDVWMQHGPQCERDDCSACDVAVNQLRLAYKVWKNSAHQKASLPREIEKPQP